jgi:hypothetical protein
MSLLIHANRETRYDTLVLFLVKIIADNGGQEISV